MLDRFAPADRPLRSALFRRGPRDAVNAWLYLTLALMLWACGLAAAVAQGGGLPRVELNDEERAWLRAHPVIRVAQSRDWAPVEFADRRGQPSGMSDDYLKLVEQALGIRFERLPSRSWADVMAGLKNGKVDLALSVAETLEKAKFLVFTQPYIRMPIVVFTRAEHSYIGDLKELAGKRVAIGDGYAVADWVSRDYPELQLVKINSAEEGLALLQQGKALAYIDNMLVVSHSIANLDLVNIKVAGQTPYVNAQSMAVRKDWPLLVGILQKVLSTIPEAQRLEIYRKWLPVRDEPRVNYWLIGEVVAAVAVITLGLLAWNWRLSREVRQRKAAEASLAANEHFLRTVTDNIPGLIGYWNRDLICVFSNDAYQTWFGKTKEQLLGGHLRDLLGEELFALNTPHIKAVLAGTPQEFERIVPHLNGNLHHTRANYIPDWDGNKVQGFFVVVIDITALKKIQLSLQQANRELADSNLELEQFAYVASHDLQEPLRAVSSSVQLLQRRYRGQLDARADEFIAHAVSGSLRMQTLIEDLLALSRVSVVPRPSAPVDCEAALVLALANLAESIAESGAQISHDALPTVGVDPSQMAQLLQNLIGNALKFRGDKPAVVHVGARREGADWLFSVADQGIGIAPEYFDRVFELFKRLHGRESYAGTGIGLTICKKIVECHGGRIWVESEPGHGVTFFFTLPQMTGSSKSAGSRT